MMKLIGLKGIEPPFSIADIIKNSIRSIDVAIRWSGEEFLLILPEIDINGALNLAEKIREKTSITEISYKEYTLKITATFEIDEYKGEDIEKCIRDVDDALYI